MGWGLGIVWWEVRLMLPLAVEVAVAVAFGF